MKWLIFPFSFKNLLRKIKMLSWHWKIVGNWWKLFENLWKLQNQFSFILTHLFDVLWRLDIYEMAGYFLGRIKPVNLLLPYDGVVSMATMRKDWEAWESSLDILTCPANVFCGYFFYCEPSNLTTWSKTLTTSQSQ